jgi:dipeptidase
MSSCKLRQQVSSNLGKAKANQFEVGDALSILSHHHLENDLFAPHKASTQDICMHATGLTNPSHTVGSMIAEIRQDQVPTIWLTGTSNPCLSIFKPFFFQTFTISEEKFTLPTAKANESLWWKSEALHRLIAQHYQQNKHIIDTERIKLQGTLLEREIEIFTTQSPKTTDLQAFSDDALQKHLDLIATWHEKISTASKRADYFAPMYQWHWKRWNRSIIS